MEVSLAHLDQFLTNYSVVYRNQDFVAGRLFPDFPVSKQNDRYPIFGFERFKAYQTERARRSSRPMSFPHGECPTMSTTATA